VPKLDFSGLADNGVTHSVPSELASSASSSSASGNRAKDEDRELRIELVDLKADIENLEEPIQLHHPEEHDVYVFKYPRVDFKVCVRGVGARGEEACGLDRGARTHRPRCPS
jgi:hypothetical protein